MLAVQNGWCCDVKFIYRDYRFQFSKPKQPIYFNESREIFFTTINLSLLENLSVERMRKKKIIGIVLRCELITVFLLFHTKEVFMIVIEYVIFSAKCSMHCLRMNNKENKRKKTTTITGYLQKDLTFKHAHCAYYGQLLLNL